jgi:ArsR family transcriptional regulator
MEAAIFDDLTLLADSVRSRMVALLERHELTVTELCAVFQLPQSTVSRHLKMLADAGWVTSRREATSRYYSAVRSPKATTGKLWSLLRDQVAGTSAVDQDARRVKAVMTRRQTASQQFFESGAGRWDKIREDLFGRWSHLHALLGLIDERCTVADLGCGTGQVAAVLAPYVARIIAIDRSAEMLQAARTRLREWPNVEIRRGELEALPVDDGTLDAATLMLVLHHTSDPSAVLAAAARALREGGRLLVTDMLPHDREEYRQQMGHVWLGFSEDHVHRLLSAAGFDRVRITALDPGGNGRGPALFVATARKVSAQSQMAEAS